MNLHGNTVIVINENEIKTIFLRKSLLLFTDGNHNILHFPLIVLPSSTTGNNSNPSYLICVFYFIVLKALSFVWIELRHQDKLFLNVFKVRLLHPLTSFTMCHFMRFCKKESSLNKSFVKNTGADSLDTVWKIFC